MGQLGRFAGVGLIATLAHVLVALIAKGALNTPAQMANILGFTSSVGLSYLGHSTFTFGMTKSHGFHLPRFIAVALAGLLISSLTTFIVYTKWHGSFELTMSIVAVAVPAFTFLAAKFWAFSEAQDRSAPLWTGFFIAAGVAIAFFAVLNGHYINHDTAWYLVATRKWLSGAKLYVDIVEVNPPLNFYLTIPAIWLADLFGLSDTNGQYLLIAILLWISLSWVWLLLARDDRYAFWRKLVLLACIGGAVTIPVNENIGQREHLMVILILPYLLGFLTLPEMGMKTDMSHHKVGGTVARAAFAAIGLCIKPFFMVFPIAVTLTLIWRHRSLRPIWGSSNMVMLGAGLIYIALVSILHPDYLGTIVPMAANIYGDYGFGFDSILANMRPWVLVFFGLTVFVGLRGRIKPHGLDIMAAVVLAAMASYLAQWTGYSYQAVPLFSMITIAIAWILLQSRLQVQMVLAACMCLFLLGMYSFWIGFYKSTPTTFLSDRFKDLHPSPRLMVFSSGLWVAFPLTLEVDAVWTSRYPALWTIPGSMNGLALRIAPSKQSTAQLSKTSCPKPDATSFRTLRPADRMYS